MYVLLKLTAATDSLQQVCISFGLFVLDQN